MKLELKEKRMERSYQIGESTGDLCSTNSPLEYAETPRQRRQKLMSLNNKRYFAVQKKGCRSTGSWFSKDK